MSALVLRWRVPEPLIGPRWRGPEGGLYAVSRKSAKPLAAFLVPAGPADYTVEGPGLTLAGRVFSLDYDAIGDELGLPALAAALDAIPEYTASGDGLKLALGQFSLDYGEIGEGLGLPAFAAAVDAAFAAIPEYTASGNGIELTAAQFSLNYGEINTGLGLSANFAPKASPVFTGIVTAPQIVAPTLTLGDAGVANRIYLDGTKTSIVGDVVATGLLKVGGGSEEGHQIGRLIIDYSSNNNPELRGQGGELGLASNVLIKGDLTRDTGSPADFRIRQARTGFGISFWTSPVSNSTYVERVNISANGSVGIGTAALGIIPISPLDVVNGMTLRTTSLGNPAGHRVTLTADTNGRLVVSGDLRPTTGRIVSPSTTAAFYQMGNRAHVIGSSGWNNLSDNVFSNVPPTLSPTLNDAYLNRLLHFTGIVQSTGRTTLRGLSTELTDDSAGIGNTIVGVYADVSLGANTGANRYAALLLGGNVGIGTATPQARLHVAGNIIAAPPAVAAPSANGEMTFEFTTNTTLKIKARGSDGVVREASLALA